MVDKIKLIKQKEGAIKFNSHGNNQFVLNWKDNMIEVYQNEKRIFIIDLN